MPSVALSPEEARVLGCLMEKSRTTPDQYPLSLNALVNACNQTTNRDPVVRYAESVVEDTLDALRAKGVARRIKEPGARVIKHRHVADEAFGLDPGEFAVLGVLLLRGPQTPGELKGRTERWHGFADLAGIEGALERLAGREFVVKLARQPGQKEARWAQTLTGLAAGDHEQPSAEPTVEAAEPVAHSLDVCDPATGAVVRSVAVDDEPEIAAKLTRARAAQPRWAGTPYDERALALLAFRDLLADEREECAQITTAETGKPVRQSRAEIAACAERIEWFVEHADTVVAAHDVDAPPGIAERVTYDPVGVVAHVSAWNYPWFVALNSMVPALLCGNAVLYKPSEHATLTGLRIVDLLHRCGVPAEVAQAVVGAGPTGAVLVEADVDLVCFTGSYTTGRRVALAAASRLGRVQLELGGKDPAYVCDDVEVAPTAAAVAEGAFYNAGQSCCAVERVYVHAAVWEPFTDAFVRAVEAYRVGDPRDETTDIGPLARAEQVAVLEAQVADAVARGARVRSGGSRIDRPGNWFAPTVLTDVDHSMAVMRDESFGPLIGVMRVRDDAEARALMADTEYGLTAAVFSAERGRAERLLAGLDVGSAYWNCSDRTSVRLPWAGRRRSGLGVSLSEAGVRAFVREKAWHLRGA